MSVNADAELLALPADCRCLVVDDNETNRRILDIVLTAAGGQVVHATNGQEACAAFEQALWSIILMDVQMPVLDGLTATRLIREREEALGLARTPIIVVSAFVASEDIRASRSAGADEHLAKPISVELLLRVVKTVLVPPLLLPTAATRCA